MGDIGMTITDVRVRKIAKDGKMKAIVSVTFDNEFVVHDINPAAVRDRIPRHLDLNRVDDGDQVVVQAVQEAADLVRLARSSVADVGRLPPLAPVAG